MGKGSRGQLTIALNSHIQSIHDTLQMLDQSTVSSLEKVDWSEVTKLGDEISKQATVAGMLWSGEAPNSTELEENIAAYFNLLQGLLLLCYGSMVGAGPTLCASIRASAKQIVDCSLSLFKEGVSSKETSCANRRLSIPQLAGAIWEACSALKKTPTSNYTAVGRAITQVAVSVKDVLREMNELKPGSISTTDDASDEATLPLDDHGSMEGDDLGNDLSPEEMAVAQSVTAVVSDTLQAIKELIRYITGLVKQSNHPNNSIESVGPLERLLVICREIRDQVDEIGACVYPPQEISLMNAAAEKISCRVNQLRAEVQSIGGSMEGFFHACVGLETSLRKLESEFSCLDTDLVPGIQNLSAGS